MLAVATGLACLTGRITNTCCARRAAHFLSICPASHAHQGSPEDTTRDHDQNDQPHCSPHWDSSITKALFRKNVEEEYLGALPWAMASATAVLDWRSGLRSARPAPISMPSKGCPSSS